MSYSCTRTQKVTRRVACCERTKSNFQVTKPLGTDFSNFATFLSPHDLFIRIPTGPTSHRERNRLREGRRRVRRPEPTPLSPPSDATTTTKSLRGRGSRGRRTSLSIDAPRSPGRRRALSSATRSRARAAPRGDMAGRQSSLSPVARRPCIRIPRRTRSPHRHAS